VAGGDRAECVRGEDDRVADWRGRLVSDARARESEGECGWRVGSGCSEGEGARGAGWGGHERGERGYGYGPGIGPARGEGFSFYFYFLFPFSISISFISFPLEQLIN
jgi:hypothetical protein